MAEDYRVEEFLNTLKVGRLRSICGIRDFAHMPPAKVFRHQRDGAPMIARGICEKWGIDFTAKVKSRY